jgi:hypothetical protein
MQNVIDMCNVVSLIHDPEFSKEDCELAIKVMLYTHGKDFVTNFMDRYIEIIKEENNRRLFNERT